MVESLGPTTAGRQNQLQTPGRYAFGVFETFDPPLKHTVQASVALDQCMLTLYICHRALDGIYSQFQIATVNSLGRASEMCEWVSKPFPHTS